jgi:peptidoglycan/xylan/chitin deacetylase (PgdA/CDA1 family)
MGDVLVLCYHAISRDWPAALATTPERFEEQLKWLGRRGYVGATFEQAVTNPPAKRTVAITFDDAFQSVVDFALPIMRRLGVPGSIFVPTNFPDKPGAMAWEGTDQWLESPHEGELRCLPWDGLRALHDEGWEVGSHTRSHPHLTSLDDQTLADELEGSRAACESALGAPCRSLAYPYGDVDRRVIEATGRAGYAVAAALPEVLGSTHPLDWPRVGIYHLDDLRRFRLKVSRIGRLVRSSKPWARRKSGG